MRTIELHLDEERIKHDNRKQLSIAIGYLASWNLSGYDNVSIYNDGDNDLIATYASTETGRSYVIGAVWRESSQEYSFHS